METDQIIATVIILVAGAFMWWQGIRNNRAADRAEAAAKEAEAAEARALAAQEAARSLHAKVAGHAAAIDHHRQTTGRTVYSYGPDGEIRGDDRG